MRGGILALGLILLIFGILLYFTGNNMVNEMHEGKNSIPEHVEVDTYEESDFEENPFSKGLNVMVSVPDTIEIRMVDASVLGDYEVWFFISSILVSAVVGFFVASLQSEDEKIFLINTYIFVILFIISIIMAILKRNKLRTKSKKINLKATEIITDE